MIDPGELRLGNILHHKSGKTVDVTVGIIEQFVCDKKFSNKVWYPIHLTEEWLIKLGLHEVLGVYAVYGRELNLKLSDGYWEAYFKGKYVYVIKHVHQLQNLFYALTGQELVTKPAN
ncbi:hypothetical protein FKG96_12560 [Olivibacter sp. LS-1]|uniref:hypothetical protein n=1 Tax=Olivibacter sp. LS-1 TaxID=2592345 RepID=UPI0011EABA56|nr:hypothetical protein [Olivibacter sp. LS-1]QEL01604.1 hypothetical protein FKG96_12560 [Olivibacter sp. LS-1]